MTAMEEILKRHQPDVYKELLTSPFAVQKIVSLIGNPDNTVAIKAVCVIAQLSYSDL